MEIITTLLAVCCAVLAVIDIAHSKEIDRLKDRIKLLEDQHCVELLELNRRK